METEEELFREYPYLKEGSESFMSQLEELLKKHGEGKYAVFHRRELVGVYGDFEMAFETGCKKTGTDKLYVRQIDSSCREYGHAGKPLDFGWPSVVNPDGSISAMY